MAENKQLSELMAFRQIYVEERRKLVETALFLRKANGDGGLHGAGLSSIQEILDAIDRAIMDEQRIAMDPPVPTSVPMRSGGAA
ncbi:hypothetical protein [Mesorhizobium sp. M8A.F.Ca.ET.165.01.1.1]|uniref:hypothetical protein n=1 Tax=Mesorhizobium sp. M8A.F.Ca.ET.165.01.1.1 TaxID=2563960 RepID=UPI0010938CE0|nr:hypothetical protein [Mesorhizobium sp. M8A.F.Ca.ET.165.01.1.1]TGT42613.1 hypothetical protein EN808_12015 [Mesorhizobium sp. M8A.F.Ca.ET.165.01.1.1]